jgi:hypothetical protein
MASNLLINSVSIFSRSERFPEALRMGDGYKQKGYKNINIF